MKQIRLFKDENIAKVYGGSLTFGKRKGRRPLDSKKPLHLVLKCTNSFMLLRNKKLVEQLAFQMGHRFGIKIYALGVHADHVHLNIGINCRNGYVKWIRALTGSMSKKIKGLKFKFLPFTRVGTWGKGFISVQHYIKCNRREGEFLLAANLYAEARAREVHGWAASYRQSLSLL